VRIWGLSKTQANYRPAPTREVRCARCKYMFPPLALGGCRLVRDRSEAPQHATNSLLAMASPTPCFHSRLPRFSPQLSISRVRTLDARAAPRAQLSPGCRSSNRKRARRIRLAAAVGDRFASRV